MNFIYEQNVIYTPARAEGVNLVPCSYKLQRGRNRDMRMGEALGEEGKEGSEPREEKAKEEEASREGTSEAGTWHPTLCMG